METRGNMTEVLASRTENLNEDKNLEGVKVESGLFYIKEVAGSFSIYCRYSHGYMGMFDTHEKIRDFLEPFTQLEEEDLWRTLIFEHKQHFKYKDMQSFKMRMKDEERQLTSAWKRGTVAFYELYPQIFIEVEEPPFQILRKIYSETDTDIIAQRLEEERLKASGKPEPIDKLEEKQVETEESIKGSQSLKEYDLSDLFRDFEEKDDNSLQEEQQSNPYTKDELYKVDPASETHQVTMIL